MAIAPVMASNQPPGSTPANPPAGPQLKTPLPTLLPLASLRPPQGGVFLRLVQTHAVPPDQRERQAEPQQHQARPEDDGRIWVGDNQELVVRVQGPRVRRQL